MNYKFYGVCKFFFVRSLKKLITNNLIKLRPPKCHRKSEIVIAKDPEMAEWNICKPITIYFCTHSKVSTRCKVGFTFVIFFCDGVARLQNSIFFPALKIIL